MRKALFIIGGTLAAIALSATLTLFATSHVETTLTADPFARVCPMLESGYTIKETLYTVSDGSIEAARTLGETIQKDCPLY